MVASLKGAYRYFEGYRYCAKCCEYKYRIDGIRCPDCHMPTRAQPRKGSLKRRFQKMIMKK